MKHGIKKRILSLVLCISIVLPMIAQPMPVYSVESEESIAPITNPFTPETIITLPDGTTTSSQSYRIPSMVTLADGTIVAAADIRWNTTYDGGGLDTLVARSTDGGVTWSYSIANYLGDNGNEYNSQSTAFIDPSLTVAADGKTIYLLCDLYPYGIALNGSGNTQPSSAVGFNDDGYLKLSGDDHWSYTYYLKDGAIYDSSNTAVSGYTVDEYFNLYSDGSLTSNLFHSDSPYKVVRTGFLYLTSSTDGGATWSAPTLLNLKTTSENVCLVGPGRGITTADGTIVVPVYSYGGSSDSQRTGFIYSKDGINWERSQSGVNWSSEAAVVEIAEGTLRFFYRNGTSALCYVDYDMSSETWGSYVNTGIATNSNTQLSAITYSKTANGKQVVLVSCPTGPNASGSNNNNGGYRLNGRVFAGIVNDDGTMTWSEVIKVNSTTATSADTTTPYTEDEGFFAYSCLTERSDGSIALLYENRENAWGAGDSCYYSMNIKAYGSSDLGLDFDSDDDDSNTDVVVPDEPSSIVSSNGVSISSKRVTFTGLTVTKLTAPTASFIENSIAYDVIPQTENGSYTGSALVTIAIPEGWDSAKVFGYVRESDGSLTVLTGTVSSVGTFSYTVPHFSETGLFEATAIDDITDGTIVLEIGETSSVITVSGTANVGTEGEHTTADRKINYTVTHIPASTGATYEVANVYCSNLISGNNSSWQETGYYYTTDGTNYYPLYAKRTSQKNGRQTTYTYTWGYSTTSSSTDVTQIGTAQSTTNTNTAPTITVYTKVEGDEISASTTVTFTGLDVTSGTEVTIGGTTYTVIVNAKSAEESKFIVTNNTTTLDALTDLGLTGTGYTVSYAETADEGNAITVNGAQVTAGGATGEATVTATVKSASGSTVGTVTYTITVSAVIIDDVENIYVPVNGTAIIEGLSGDIYTGMFDESIASYTVANNGTITFTGVADGKTSLVVGNTQINIYVNPENTGSGADTQKHIYVNVDAIENCTVYYAINGGTLHEIEGTGVLIDQTYYDGFNIMFFAAPDEGYALTQMSVTNSDDQYYSLSDGSLSDGSDSSAWPFDSPTQTTIPSSGNDSAWVSGHGFRWSLIEGNMSIEDMRDLFTRALALGADGATTFTKNSSDGLSTDVSFLAEKLPNLEKNILSVNGLPYNEGMTLEFEDIVTYQFVITSYSSNVNYTDITLSDGKIGYSQTIANGTFNTAGTYTYTASYTINRNDINKYANGTFQNDATLSYTYSSTYSTGEYDYSDSASVSCKINGIVYYVWMESLPEGITDDTTNYPLPGSETVTYGETVAVKPYTGKQSYEGIENGITVGTWNFKGWQYDNTFYEAGSTLTMPDNDSVEFVGIWEYTPSQQYSVTYQWTNAPADVTIPTDSSSYYEGQTYTVDGSYYEGFEYDDGTTIWTFSGWELSNTVVSGVQTMGNTNVLLVGEWTSEQKFSSLTIYKEGYSQYEAIDPNQSFLFRVTGDGVDLIVTVHGNGSTTINGLIAGGKYTITELIDWSWRYEFYSWQFISGDTATANGNTNNASVTLGSDGNTITFTNTRDENKWLDGDNWLDNLFKGN